MKNGMHYKQEVNGREKMAPELHQYSSAEYCESGDSSARHCLQYHSHKKLHHLPTCRRKQYRIPISSYLQYHRPTHYSNRKSHRICGRRRMTRTLEETTSVDDRKSIESYSSTLTVDVRKEMEEVNRDLEDIIRRCDDDYCMGDNSATCITCPHSTNKFDKSLGSLTMEQLRILTMKRPPLEKLKDVPLSLLKARPPKHMTEKLATNSRSKFKTSRDIRHIVEETDHILRDVISELSRGKCQEDVLNCGCDRPSGAIESTPATCLERYLDVQNKYRKIHENRRMKPKWRDLFERGDYYIRRAGEKQKHFHDTNCISEPPTSACLATVKLPEKPSKSVLKDAGVNTDLYKPEIRAEGKNVETHIEPSIDIVLKEKDFAVDSLTTNEKNSVISSGHTKTFSNSIHLSNYPSENSSSKSIVLKHPGASRVRLHIDHYETISNMREGDKDEKISESLLLDRNMGLSLAKTSEIVTNNAKSDVTVSLVKKNSVDQWSNNESRPVIPPPTPDLCGSRFEDGFNYRINKRNDAGDTEDLKEPSYSLISHIIDKIANKSTDWSSNSLQALDVGGYAGSNSETCQVDSWTCLEIMRRLVIVLSRNYSNIAETFVDMPAQYSRIRKIKLNHLVNIEKEILCIKDLEFYLKNAGAKSTTA